MITIKDISNHVGVSVTQVSRALNGHDDVSESTREQVLKAAKDLGYVKNIAAHRLVTKTSNQIAFIVVGKENDSDAHYNSSMYTMMKGVNDYSLKNNLETIIYMLLKKRSYIDFIRERGLDGAIIAGLDYDDPSLEEILSSDLACVLIDIPVTGERNGSVQIDNSYFTAQAVQALINSGKKNIAMINGAAHSMVSIERECGYKIAHASNQIKYNPKYIINADWQYEKAYEVTKRLLTENKDIDGFFCSSDTMAFGCLNSVKDMGYKVPEDIGIVGFDGILETNYTQPPLATVVQDYYQKGYRAADLYCQIVSGKILKSKAYLVDCNLILKGSVV
ncbi:MAG: LacI family DNA-binding transcriptional regulator [Clostridiales bacterium]|nr:LacI family DNA-binding transcriptional regulator [Clostridiales bacterium]